MSMHRPSKRTGNQLPQPVREPSRTWLRRVFHGTYTRGGRRMVLRGWSVKIQHAGHRRTFSLAARTRAGAAGEARAIYERAAAGDWDAVVRQYGGKQGSGSSRTDPRWWKERLLVRNYPAPPDGARPQQFSVRIEHAGASCYFPLGTNQPEVAAAHALEIYRRIADHGWINARREFAREATLALNWAHDPLLWTYTTIHTAGSGPEKGSASALGVDDAATILLVETDGELRRALAQCLERSERLNCIPCATVARARRLCADDPPILCVVNRDLAGSLGLAHPAQIGTLPGSVPTVTYSVHVDSEELFALTPGGASGYVLRRTSAENILEPVARVLNSGRVTAEALLQAAQSHFQELLQPRPPEKTSLAAQLTQREQDVLSLMSRGYPEKEMAPMLGISAWTVHEHVKRIFEKLQVHSRTEAVLAYLQK